MFCREDDVACFRIRNIAGQDAADELVAQEVDSLAARACQTGAFADEVDAEYVAVIFADDDVLGNVDETTGQITRVSCTQCRIGQAFTGAVRRSEVVQYGQAFAEVRFDRQVDDTTRRVSHQATHAGNLTNLVAAASSTGVSHHEDRVERVHVIHHDIRNVVSGLCPDFDALVIAFVFGNQAALIHGIGVLDLLVGFIEDIPFFCRDLNIRNSDGHTGLAGVMVADGLDLVQQFCRLGVADEVEAGIDEFADLFLAHEDAQAVDVDIFFIFLEFSHSGFVDLTLRQGARSREVDTEFFFQLRETIVADMAFFVFDLDEVGPVDEAVFIGEDRVLRVREDHDFIRMEEAQWFIDLIVVEQFACRRFDEAVARDADLDQGFDVDDFGIVSEHDFIVVGENLAFALGSRFDQGQVISTEDHVLCRDGDRFAIFRSQDVMRRKHERPRFGLGFYGKRQMAGHLVTVKVGVECRANQRMQFDGAAFPEDRFESLDTQTMQCRGAVQEDRMFLDDVFQDVPDFTVDAFDFLLSVLDIGSNAFFDKFLHDERLEEFQGHFFRQAALVHLHFRTDDDNRTARVVDTFTEQVLAETALFPFQHIRQGFQGTVARARDRTAAAAVIDEGIDGFLEHTFFVADDDVRCAQFQEAAQAVVTVDDPAIEIVQVRRSEAAAVELYHRAQFRRDDRDDIHNHPFRFVAGVAEGFDDFQPADSADAALARRIAEFIAELFVQLVQVQALQQFLDSCSAHADAEFIAVHIQILTIFRFRHQLLLGKRRIARIEDDVRGEV